MYVALFLKLYPLLLCVCIAVGRPSFARHQIGDSLYPILLSVCAFAGYFYCNWFQWHDRESRTKFEDYSYKYVLISAPQFFSMFVLFYYACTFKRRGSEFAHQLMAESCVHQSCTTALVLSVLHGGFHMMHSGCCAFPTICPVDYHACELGEIFHCPQRLVNEPHFDFGFRAAHMVATCVILVAMSSVAPVHRFKHLRGRVRRAEFLTFDRSGEAPQRPPSPTVPI